MKCTMCTKEISNEDQVNYFSFCKRCFGILFVPDHPEGDKYIAPNKIDEYLWLGPQFSAIDKKALLELGIKHILRVGDDLEVPKLEGIDYHEVIIEDCSYSDIAEHFEKMMTFINKGVDKKEGVLVHCKAGISRSATTVIAYIMFSKRLTLASAWEFVRSKRPSISPNQGFVKQLKEYEEKLSKLFPLS